MNPGDLCVLQTNIFSCVVNEQGTSTYRTRELIIGWRYEKPQNVDTMILIGDVAPWCDDPEHGPESMNHVSVLTKYGIRYLPRRQLVELK